MVSCVALLMFLNMVQAASRNQKECCTNLATQNFLRKFLQLMVIVIFQLLRRGHFSINFRNISKLFWTIHYKTRVICEM